MRSIKDVTQKRLLELKITAKEYSKRLGINQQSLNTIYERNSTSIDTLEKMASVLGISISEFFEEPQRLEEPPVGYRVIRNEDYIQLLEDAYGRTKKELAEKNA